MSTLAESVKDRLNRASGLLGQLKAEPRLDLIGRVERVGDNVASVRGLPETRLGELLLFERSDGGEPVVGIVLTLDPDLIGCAMLGDDSVIRAGNLVRGTGSVASVPVGDNLLGRTVNALGVPVDGGPEIEAAGVESVEGRRLPLSIAISSTPRSIPACSSSTRCWRSAVASAN